MSAKIFVKDSKLAFKAANKNKPNNGVLTREFMLPSEGELAEPTCGRCVICPAYYQ